MNVSRWALGACLFLFCLSVNAQSHRYAQTLLTELSGKQITLSSLHGKWVMINYWASWCQPCLDEIHELNTFYRHNQKKVALFAVNYEGLTPKKQAELIRNYHLTYPSLREDPAAILGFGDLVGVPVTFVLNRKGVLVETLYGPQTRNSLSHVIQ